MGINPIFERHLLDARRELVAARESLDQDIARIDLLLSEAAASEAEVGTGERWSDKESQSPSLAKAAQSIQWVDGRTGRDLSDSTVVYGVKGDGKSGLQLPGNKIKIWRGVKGPEAPQTYKEGSYRNAEAFIAVVRDKLADVDITGASPSPAMREAVMDYLACSDRPQKTQDISRDLAQAHGWEESSVRSLVSRLHREGDIYQVRRGWYSLGPYEGPLEQEIDLLSGDVAEDD